MPLTQLLINWDKILQMSAGVEMSTNCAEYIPKVLAALDSNPLSVQNFKLLMNCIIKFKLLVFQVGIQLI